VLMQSSKHADSGQGGMDFVSESTASIPDLIRKRAEVAPGDLAVRAGSGRLSYREFEIRANRLANYLRGSGVAPGQIVGLCLERGLDFPVAALAALKLGAAYLPLEPKAPAKRLETVLPSARVSLVLTNCKTHDLPHENGVRIVDLSGSKEVIDRCPEDAPAVHVTPDQTAYVILTSGSTGVPKAVAVGHASLLNLMRWHIRAFQVTAADRATQLASIGFDAAVWELWPYLAAGASIHVVDDETRMEPEKLRDWLVREKITVSFTPTPLAERMLKLSWPKSTALRFLLIGADTLHFYPPAGLPFTLVNNYGPTECTVVATSATVSPQKADRPPAIGRAIDNTQVLILDDKLQRVPAGTVGEIYVAGVGLAQGYLNDAQLTEQRFMKNPFSDVPGARLYRTGDLGSCLPDGQISFHGRADDQVKINGFRIELNDVNSALRRHASVRESVVSARENESGERQLVAYIVPSGSSPSVSDLREFLAKELPEYMLPSIFVSLTELPYASSGKVNRLALPAPDEGNMLRDQLFHQPSSATEERVSAIVASLLGLPRVAVNDNFFYLGGNSLFGTQLIARLRDAFQVEVPLLSLFDHPTVSDLSVEVERLMVARLDAMSDEEAQRLLTLNTAQASL
jgi:amino acid adenylation domain-containing protein